MNNEFIEHYIRPVMEVLYTKDALLFDQNLSLSERCIAFRFAHYLQNKFDELGEYNVFVDCDYNSHLEYENGEWKRHPGKPIQDRDGSGVTGRFIDLIVHQRKENKDSENWSDLICFELKKWDNPKKERGEKDKNNLERLTSDYGYHYGFHIIFGPTKEAVQIEIFEGGQTCGGPLQLFQ